MSFHQTGYHFCLPCPSESIETPPTQLLGTPKLLLEAFPYKQAVLARVVDFNKISQRFTKPKAAASGFGMPLTLAEQP